MIDRWKIFGKVRAGNVISSFVDVGFPGLCSSTITAKIDTGAYSGAIHATNIREFTSKNGQKKLAFNPFGDKDNRVRLTAFHERSVKSSNGDVSSRYAINTEIALAGTVYPITITLANRSAMKYQTLIGRKFLQNHGFVVDLRGDQK